MSGMFFVVAIIYEHKPSLDFDLVFVVRVLTGLPKYQIPMTKKHPQQLLLDRKSVV